MHSRQTTKAGTGSVTTHFAASEFERVLRGKGAPYHALVEAAPLAATLQGNAQVAHTNAEWGMRSAEWLRVERSESGTLTTSPPAPLPHRMAERVASGRRGEGGAQRERSG